jgi:transcription antitermination protein NusB
MQSLYTYFNNKSVNLEDIRQKVFDGLIEEPDFYNAEQKDKTGFQMLLPVLLDEAFANKLDMSELQENQKWLGVLAKKAVLTWKKENEAELDRIRTGVYQDIIQQNAIEVSFWQMFSSLIEYARTQEDRKQGNFLNNEPSPEHELKITYHPYYILLNRALHPEKGNPPSGFLAHDRELIHRLYTLLFKELPEYKTYRDKKEVSREEEDDIWKVLYRKLFKSQPFNELMQEKDLHWSENRILLEVSLKATFKGLGMGEVPQFKRNDEEDKEYREFFNTLLNSSLENFEEDEKRMAETITNWESDRVALLDKWIIHLSINEMRKFPHIPVKVTMNEYLEIAKAYSTPGSAGFINGVVDKLAAKMKGEGIIRKSAKGLMDNK